jgi:hypothetical protein
MKLPRIVVIACALIVTLSLALGWQVYSLFGQVRARDRVIRSLGLRLQVTAKGLQPIREELSGKDGALISLRSKLRRKERQMESISIQSLQREDEVIALRDNLKSKEIKLPRSGGGEFHEFFVVRIGAQATGKCQDSGRVSHSALLMMNIQ